MESREIIERSIHAMVPGAILDLDIVHGRVSGTVIAAAFEAMPHLQRVRTVRDKVLADLGRDADDLGMLLFYTPAEAEEANLAGKAAQVKAVQERGRR